MTRAPARCASSRELSVDRLSTTITSPRTPARSNQVRAFWTQLATVFSSLRQGSTTETSISADPASAGTCSGWLDLLAMAMALVSQGEPTLQKTGPAATPIVPPCYVSVPLRRPLSIEQVPGRTMAQRRVRHCGASSDCTAQDDEDVPTSGRVQAIEMVEKPRDEAVFAVVSNTRSLSANPLDGAAVKRRVEGEPPFHRAHWLQAGIRHLLLQALARVVAQMANQNLGGA